ncbi:MAG: lactate utilization protein [Bryobacteraceae bacterium]|nr:lactate utilization protein [Bryobacteraceae bacterium]
MARDKILHKVRTALGRSPGQPTPPPPPARLRLPEVTLDQRIDAFVRALETLAGKVFVAASPEEALAYTANLCEGRTAVASNAPLLAECGITRLAAVQSGFHERAPLRAACAQAGIGITSADYALADTGSLVMFSCPAEARLISLLPPVHLAVVDRRRLLTGLDELYSLHPLPSGETSAMVFITGPSRTADIEQILIRGVHGPREIHVVLV